MASVATMDFFTSQDVARRKTARLVMLYCLAVVLIILAVYIAFALVYQFALSKEGEFSLGLDRLWNPALFLWITGGTLVVVLSGTIFKISQLSGGGEAVALMLGGRPVNPDTRDPAERKLLNIIQEISIASGVAIPQAFVLDDEEGINAFAAGFSSSDAVVAVTRGSLKELNRDQLQGVIAHEFSHILNGDMRLNIRLTGVLYGILVISMIGYWLMRAASRTRGSSRSKGGALYIILLGFLLFIIGYIGVFFGRLIQCAVSRQREYLADASAVQFTRNPLGLAGALKKIGGFISGSKIMAHNASEASHFFFADGISSWFFASHPPLADRIRKLDPEFSGDFAAVAAAEPPPVEQQAAPDQMQYAAASLFGFGSKEITITPEEVVNSVGRPRTMHLTYASRLLSNVPVDVAEVIRTPVGAQAMVFALLLSPDTGVKQAQMRYLASNADGDTWMKTSSLADQVVKFGAAYRMPLADIAMSALRNMPPDYCRRFQSNVDSLVDADQQIDLFEYTLKAMIDRRLEAICKKKKVSAQYYNLKPLGAHCSALLSCLAYWGSDNPEAAKKSFASGAEKLEAGLGLAIGKPEDSGLDALDTALQALKAVSQPLKRNVIDACVSCVGADGVVTVEEAELLRAIADNLDCPMPPMMATAMAA